MKDAVKDFFFYCIDGVTIGLPDVFQYAQVKDLA
jgi:hypothetical protein